MLQITKRIAILALGWFFIVLGIAGLFLPVLQGILFLLIGLVLLSGESRWARRLLVRLRRRFPGIDHALNEARDRARSYLRRMRSRGKAGP